MKKVCKAVLMAAMMAVILLGMTACSKTKLDLSEGMVIVFEGPDGNGKADLDFPDNDGTPNYVNAVLESGKVDATDLMTWMVIDDAITYDIDPIRELSNGDTVTVTITVKESVLENMGFTAKPYEKTFTVEGLTEVIEVDAFKNFEVTFSGISPAATASFPASQEVDGVTVYYRCEDKTHLKDGEEFTVTAAVRDRDHYKVREETKTFVVSDVDKYLTTSSELQPEMLERLKAKGDEVVADRVSRWGYFTYHGYEYVGYEFWGMPDSNGLGIVNYVYLYYKINCNDGEKDFPTYYYVCFNNVVEHTDGTQDADMKYYKCPTIMFYETMKDYMTLESRTRDEADINWGYTVEKHFD